MSKDLASRLEIPPSALPPSPSRSFLRPGWRRAIRARPKASFVASQFGQLRFECDLKTSELGHLGRRAVFVSVRAFIALHRLDEAADSRKTIFKALPSCADDNG